ncbi:MAG: endonuclease/exonuclease/phosphatase family protein [Aeriscardovia sp.]|nr:endonuclease/exonuclease/phosphatase family protein [Aeriscardovia sp.]
MTTLISTSNLNGLRAAWRKGLGGWIEDALPDVLCVQEVRAPEDALGPIFSAISDIYASNGKKLHIAHQVCKVPGRAGVALFSVFPFESLSFGLPGLDDNVDTGRWIEAGVKLESGMKVRVICAYVHSGESADGEKMAQKYRFLDRATLRIEELLLEGGSELLVCGDLNIAHTPSDIKNARENLKNSGFLPEERSYLDKWLSLGLEDEVRALRGSGQGPYSWWSYRGRAFDRDAGWRLDYELATPGLARKAEKFSIYRAPSYGQRFSDHGPVSVEYEC